MRPPSIFYQRFSRLLATLMMIVASAAAIAQEQPQSAEPAFIQVVKTDNPDASGPTQMTLPLEPATVYDVTINLNAAVGIQTSTAKTQRRKGKQGLDSKFR